MILSRLFGSNPLAHRLAKGMGATALGPVVTVLIQLGTVPALLHSWGAAKYGDWLLLSAVPSYLTLSNLGFGDASASDMTVRVAAGDRAGALETFQSSLALLVAISTLILAVVAGLVWVMPWHAWMHLASLSDREAAWVVLAFAAYIIVSQQCGVLESGFRCDGNFAAGNFWATVMRLVEALLAAIVGCLTGSLLFAAIAYLAARILGTGAYAMLLRRKSPWLVYGFQHARLYQLRSLLGPALGFMAMPLGYAVSLQGYTLLIGSLKGPVAVTMFSTLRTMTRFNFQLMSVIAWAIWPELSSAFGAGDIALARILHRRAYQAGLVLSLMAAAFLWVAGPGIYHLWLGRSVAFDESCFHVLILVTFANSLWFTSSVVPMSTNAHQHLAFAFVAGSCVSLAVAPFLMRHMGLTGAACALLLIDSWMIWLVLRASLRQLQDNLFAFLASLFVMPALPQLRRARGTV